LRGFRGAGAGCATGGGAAGCIGRATGGGGAAGCIGRATGPGAGAIGTAFGGPTGEGRLAGGEVEEAAAAIEEVNADYARHARAARRLAEEWFEGRAVVGRLLGDLGMG